MMRPVADRLKSVKAAGSGTPWVKDGTLMLLTRSLLLCTLSIITGACWACYAPPSGQLMDPYAQTALANSVVLAKVIGATPRHDNVREVDYQFLVLKRLTGPDQLLFSMSGRVSGQNRDTTFNNHQDEAFWQRGGGRMMNDTDCVIHPDFIVGRTYLVFRDGPVTRRSFEKIETTDGRSADDDKWFVYVRSHVKLKK